MSADAMEAAIFLLVSAFMLSVGLGLYRMPPNPNFKFLDPASPMFRRLMLAGGLCGCALSLLRLL